jgi:hypothetical protein
MATGANANININAVDNTRAAFLGVQRNLRGVQNQVATFGRAWSQGFGRMALNLGGPIVALNMLRSHIRSVISDIDNIPGVSKETINSINELKLNFSQTGTEVKRVTAEIIGFFARIPTNFKLLAFQLATTKEEADKARKALEGIREARLENAKINSPEYQEQLKQIKQRIEAEREGLRRIGETKEQALAAEMKNTAELSKRMNSLKAESIEYQQLELERVRSLQREARIVIELNKEKERTAQVMQPQMDAFTMSMVKMFDNVGDRAAQLFGEVVTTGRASFGELARIVAQSMVEIVARMAVINPLLNFVFGGVSGFQALPTLFGGPRAMGGPVSSGKSYLVGERGPEIFTPSSAGNVISNEKTMAGGKGGSTYYIDARGADQTGLARLEAMIRQTQAAIVPMALGAMQDARARGGAFAV